MYYLRVLLVSGALAALATPEGLLAQGTHIALPTQLIPGYSHTHRGEELKYHSPIHYVDRSLLVRSLNRDYGIEWETEPVPDGFAGDTAVFVLLAGIDVTDEPRRFDLFVNGRQLLRFRNPVRGDRGLIVWTGEEGVRADFRITLIDKYGDAMGFIFLRVPKHLWEESRSLRLAVAGESAGERTWFMVFKEGIAPQLIVRNAPALLRGEQDDLQVVRVDVLTLEEELRFGMSSSLGRIDTLLTLGLNRFQLPVPAVDHASDTRLHFQVGSYRENTVFAVEPVRHLDLYLIHHTHLDIGYTHHQDEVERLQWQHLEDALRYGAASARYPDGARFVWNPEGLWAVESYLENQDSVAQQRLVDGVGRGWIALDGLFANLLTGLASSEGLMRGLETSQRLTRRTGTVIESAMISDIPGFTWGLVPVLAQHGIRYLSAGPNFGHRIGYFLDEWGDHPFYWESPSGRERVLTWVSGAGYAWFHSGLGYSRITKALDDENVFKYVDQLVDGGYPFEIAHMRYNIGSDNGPPDPNLADAVRDWNDRYVSPRLIISSTSELFRKFESRYGAELPVYRGDLTGYWEDGAASSARETALIRRTAESLSQTEVLSALLDKPLSESDLYEAWKNVLLYYEHTWGSWNSVSEPESEFTRRQWQRKREFAEAAIEGAARLRGHVVGERSDVSQRAGVIEVFNTSSWTRSDVVLLPAPQSSRGDRVLNGEGRPVPSQRLSTGELAFRADEIPAFGSRLFTIEDGPAWSAGTATAKGAVISNGEIRIEVDTLDGTISSLVYGGRELVEPAGRLNQFLYVAGRSPDSAKAAGPAEIRVKERGPLVVAIETTAAAPGTESKIRSEVRLYDDIDRVDIVNFIDKALVYDPEAVLYEFRFGIEDPEIRVDVPWGSYQPEEQQLPGSAKNYLSLERWVDVHNPDVGVSFVSIDVPLIQLGKIRTDAIVSGWVEQLEPSATLFSYAMNNYWETNYRAGQSGPHTFRYSIAPHDGFDEARTERFAREIGQPLLALPVRAGVSKQPQPFAVAAQRSVVTMLRLARGGRDIIVRLHNPGRRPDRVSIEWAEGSPGDVYLSNVHEEKVERLSGAIDLGPYQILTLRISR